MSKSETAEDLDERCPLCPVAGPPTSASLRDEKPLDATEGDDRLEKSDPAQEDIDDIANLVWIACSRCETWFHSCCLLLANTEIRETIPQGVRDEVETSHSDEAPFFDWTVWISRW